MSDAEHATSDVNAPSRRDALKMAGAATLGGVAASVVQSASAAAILREQIVTNRFSVQIGGVLVSGVDQLDLINSESTPQFSVDPSGKVTVTPGPIVDQKVRITKDWSNTMEWYNWRQTVVVGKVERKSISIVIFNDSGAALRHYNFFECWPTLYTGPTFQKVKSANAPKEILEFVYGSLSVQ